MCLVSLGQTIQEALEVEPQTPQHLPRQAQALYCSLRSNAGCDKNVWNKMVADYQRNAQTKAAIGENAALRVKNLTQVPLM